MLKKTNVEEYIVGKSLDSSNFQYDSQSRVSKGRRLINQRRKRNASLLDFETVFFFWVISKK